MSQQVAKQQENVNTRPKKPRVELRLGKPRRIPCPHCDQHYVLYRSWLSLIPNLVLFFFLCFLSVFVSNIFPETIFRVPVELLGGRYEIQMPITGLILAIAFIRPLILVYDAHHEIKCHHLSTTTGILSFRKKFAEIRFGYARGVEVHQGIIDRIFNVGDILVGSAMTAEPEVIMKGIYNPDYYAAVIEDKVEQVREEAKEIF